MNLKEFVAETLTQVVEGVTDAQERIKSHGAQVNPYLLTDFDSAAKQGMMHTKNGQAVIVQFDVALTAMEGTGTKGGIGVFLGTFTVGSTGQSQAENSTMSRIKFSVPLRLPSENTEKEN